MCTENSFYRFLRSLIINMRLDFANSKWQILYGWRKILNLVKCVWFLYLLNFNKKHILFQTICTKHIMKHPPLLIHGLGTGGGRVSFLFSVFLFFFFPLIFSCVTIFFKIVIWSSFWNIIGRRVFLPLSLYLRRF